MCFTVLLRYPHPGGPPDRHRYHRPGLAAGRQLRGDSDGWCNAGKAIATTKASWARGEWQQPDPSVPGGASLKMTSGGEPQETGHRGDGKRWSNLSEGPVTPSCGPFMF